MLEDMFVNSDDDEEFVSDKYDECFRCLNRFDISICEECELGEYFEEDSEVEELDGELKYA